MPISKGRDLGYSQIYLLCPKNFVFFNRLAASDAPGRELNLLDLIKTKDFFPTKSWILWGLHLCWFDKLIAYPVLGDNNFGRLSTIPQLLPQVLNMHP